MIGLAKLAISASVALAIVYSLPYLSPGFDETRSVVSNLSLKADKNNDISSLGFSFDNIEQYKRGDDVSGFEEIDL